MRLGGGHDPQHLIGSDSAAVVHPSLHEAIVSTVTFSIHPIHRHSLLLFFFFPSPSRRPLLGRNDGTSPTTATVSTSPSCPPRSPRDESIGHHQSSSKSLPGRTISAPLRTVTTTTTTIGSSRRSASSPTSGLLRHRIAQLSNNSGQQHRRHDERQ